MTLPNKKKLKKPFPFQRYIVPAVAITILIISAIISDALILKTNSVQTKASENTRCKKTNHNCLLSCMRTYPTDMALQENCASTCNEAFSLCESNGGARTLRTSYDNLSCPQQCSQDKEKCMGTCRMCDGEPKNMCGCKGKTIRTTCEKDCKNLSKNCMSSCSVTVTPSASPSGSLSPTTSP